jgi:hypothetical protein
VQLTYGWVRAFYRDSVPLRGLSTPTGGGFVDPGDTVPLTFGALATDLVVPEGWRLAFEFSSSAGGTVASLSSGGDVTLTSEPERFPVARDPAARRLRSMAMERRRTRRLEEPDRPGRSNAHRMDHAGR